jgi:protein tyrosine phosphatase (PTP) superfamily phosphohydrolase (DUF442 family)
LLNLLFSGIFTILEELGKVISHGSAQGLFMPSLDTIPDFLRLSDRLATSGQPTMTQFEDIRSANYQVVVNLLPIDHPQLITREAEIVHSLGMQYVHIPVVWEHPALEDLAQFLQVMTTHMHQSVFVHCAKNMRVAVFVYLYRRIDHQCSPEQAWADLQRIWSPNPVWQQFVKEALAYYQVGEFQIG